MLRFRQYEAEAKQFISESVKGDIDYFVLGLCSEAGEVADKFKKLKRDGNINKRDVVKELGDCLWYITAIASVMEVELDSVAGENLRKLKDRQKRNKIKGSGDNR